VKEMSEYFTGLWGSLARWAVGVHVDWVELVIAGIILVVATALAVLFSRVVFQRLLRLFIVGGADFDVKTVASIRVPCTAFILLLGLYLALTSLSLHDTVQHTVDKASAVIAVLIGATLVNGVASASLLWLEVYLRRHNPDRPRSWMFPLVQRGVWVLIVAITVMMALDILGINISPLVAGLGITGLAVALALQSTLGNFFAGTYVMSEGVIGAGDYIEMESGIAGYVVDINWHSTLLCTWTNNLVAVPNAMLSENVVTNYSKPEGPLDVVIYCGVSYESDLVRVETVSVEVLEQLRREHPDAHEDTEPIFRYDAFDDSNITFYMVVRANDRLASFVIRSELIKQLHSRLVAEGITFNYPMRKLQFPEGVMPQLGGQPEPQLPGGAQVAAG